MRVHAVDLHIGAPISFEVTPELIRVYLPSGTCANSVLRLYANLQHFYDAEARAFDLDGEVLVALQP